MLRAMLMPARKTPPPSPLTAESYLRLFKPYEAQLREFVVREDFSGNEEQYGARFALLFRQVTRLLVSPALFNHHVPKLYVSLAEKYLANDVGTVKHFSYEENRYYFLSELLQWLNDKHIT